jgi:hypothetical protein
MPLSVRMVVKTLALNVKAKITRAEGANDKAPDYRIFNAQSQFGPAWKKTSGAGPRAPWSSSMIQASRHRGVARLACERVQRRSQDLDGHAVILQT